MVEARLASGLWVSAYLARLNAEGIFAHVIHHGEDTAGAVAVKLATMDGQASLYTRIYDAEGRRIWDRLQMGEEAETDALIARQRGYDPDLWVIEVEDPKGRHLLDQEGLM
ncbi:MAG: DUF1491 family protein [Pseudomonadota bacterium]